MNSSYNELIVYTMNIEFKANPFHFYSYSTERKIYNRKKSHIFT